MLGLHFDPALPLVASSAFPAGGRTVEAGETFDWRAHGMTELEALALFSSGLLTHPSALVETPPQAQASRKKR